MHDRTEMVEVVRDVRPRHQNPTSCASGLWPLVSPPLLAFCCWFLFTFCLSYHRFCFPVHLARVFTLRDFLGNPLSCDTQRTCFLFSDLVMYMLFFAQRVHRCRCSSSFIGFFANSRFRRHRETQRKMSVCACVF